MKQVTATSMAFFAGRRVRPGETVQVPDDFKATWAAEPSVDAKKVTPPPKAERAPRTLSEMSRKAPPVGDVA